MKHKMSENQDIKDNYSHYLEIRNKYSKFIYHSYEYFQNDDSLDIKFHFEIEGLAHFYPSWNFPLIKSLDFALSYSLDKAIFYLGMAELVSYFKITCSPTVEVRANQLNDDEISWWKHLYFHGLGEFYYRNNILQNDNSLNSNNMTDLICNYQLNSDKKHDLSDNAPITDEKNCIIAIGGGKDSAVSLELLRAKELDNYCYIINPRGATTDTAEAYGFAEDKIYSVTRTLDKTMLELNKQGFLNGHTPFSAIVAFSATIAAIICNRKYIILSNEASADESTVISSTINHQYSKSYEFESNFFAYEKKYIKSNSYYFSLLRPLCELQIARIFAKKCRKYFNVFKSCNAGSKSNIWCCSCPKCLFVYLILSPFLKRKDLINIFGENMADKKTLLDDFKRLIGMEEEKPFECVGSIDEVNAAVRFKILQAKITHTNLDYLYQYYDDNFDFKDNPQFAKMIKFYNQNNNVPDEFLSCIRANIDI